MAMWNASKAFVHIPDLQQAVGQIIAEATGAEAGLPTAGASNAIMLAAGACIMKGTELEEYDPIEEETWSHLIQKLPMHTEGLKTKFVVQKSNRDKYDMAVELAGGRFVEVGIDEGTTEEELDAAFSPEKTAGYYFTPRSAQSMGYKCFPLETVIRIAHKNGVPVVVDAANELPPKKNLRRYIAMGADLVIFSGGKAIAGPNNSGMLAGRKDLVRLAHLLAYPFHGLGRAAKMSRETMVGLATALQIYLKHDEKAVLRACEKRARWIAKQLNKIPDVRAAVAYGTTVEEKEPVRDPVCYIEFDQAREHSLRIAGKELWKRLKDEDPRIWTAWEPAYLLEHYKRKLVIDPRYLLRGDEILIVRRIGEILAAGR